jgi:hypothetical protein
MLIERNDTEWSSSRRIFIHDKDDNWRFNEAVIVSKT